MGEWCVWVHGCMVCVGGTWVYGVGGYMGVWCVGGYMGVWCVCVSMGVWCYVWGCFGDMLLYVCKYGYVSTWVGGCFSMHVCTNMPLCLLEERI